jgi:D-3-phosphoglycerate dehydrogenase
MPPTNRRIVHRRTEGTTVMIRTVYVTDATYTHHDYERAALSDYDVRFEVRQCKTAADVIAQCADAEALLNQYAPLTREVFAALTQLKMVVRYGVGYDSVDVAAATDHGVMVVNVPDYGVQEVADHTLAMLLGIVRKIPQTVASVNSGIWNDNLFHPIMGLADKTVGLLGFGNIAREVNKRVQAFNMRVLAYDPYVATDVFGQHHATQASWQDVLSQSDIVCIHLPLNADTRHFINAERLAMMKHTAYLVNTARGGIVDAHALADALTANRLAGAALDVLEHEPMPAVHPLRGIDSCIITCHIAWYSEASLVRLQHYAGLEIARVCAGGQPKHVVNAGHLGAK